MLNPASYTSAYLTTEAAVRSYVNHSGGIPDVFVELLNADLSAKNVLPGGTNDISAYVLECQITNNLSQDSPRSVDLTLDGRVLQYMDFTVDRVRVSRIYRKRGNVILGPIPRGIFAFSQPQVPRLSYGESQAVITGNDEVSHLAVIDFFNDFVVPRGIDIGLVAKSIMMMDAYRPNEGGRQPSGIAVAGGPQASLPGGASPFSSVYHTLGVAASSVGTLNPTNGLFETPDHGLGVIQFSPYDAAQVSPASFAPLSPYSGRAMVPASGAGANWFWDVNLGLYYCTATGEWSLPFSRNIGKTVVDPFPGPVFAPYPSGMFVTQPDPAHLGSSKGTIPPPLTTWPLDYNGSGPHYTDSPTTVVTAPVGGGTYTIPDGQPVSGAFRLAERWGEGRTVLIPTGTYWVSQPIASPADPSNPSNPWLTPPDSQQFNLAEFGQGWSWSGGSWAIMLSLTGGPALTGGASILVNIYTGGFGDPANSHLKGTVSSSTANFAQTQHQSEVDITASGHVDAFSTIFPNDVWFEVIMTVSTDIAVTLDSNAGDEDSILVAGLNVGFPSVTIPPNGTFTTYGNASALWPVGSGTGVPWPDTNNPGMCPSGCYTVGLNVPAERINFPDNLGTILATLPFDRKAKHLASINQVFDMGNAYHLWQDEMGDFTTKKMPYFTADAIPESTWLFTNDISIENAGEIVSFQERVDITATANLTLDFSQGQGTSGGIFAERSNDNPASITSRSHMKRPVTKINQNDQIQTQSALDDLADNDMQSSTQGAQAFDLVIGTIPFLQSYDAISVLWINERTGEVLVDTGDFPLIVTSWKETLKSQSSGSVGQISLVAERVVVFN